MIRNKVKITGAARAIAAAGAGAAGAAGTAGAAGAIAAAARVIAAAGTAGVARATKAVAAVATLLLFAATLSSCSKEQLANGEQSDGAVRIVLSMGNANGNGNAGFNAMGNANGNGNAGFNAKSDLKTRATRAGTEPGTDDDNRIANIKVFFYGQKNRTLELFKNIDVKSQTDPDVEWKDNTITIQGVTDQTKGYVIFVAANWTEGFNADDFPLGSPLEAQSDVFTRISGPIETPDATHHLLIANYTFHNFSDEGDAHIPLFHPMAKLRIKFEINEDFLKEYPDAIFGTGAADNQLTIYNVPNSSLLYGHAGEQLYGKMMAMEGSKLFDYPPITMSDTEATVAYVNSNLEEGNSPEAKAKSIFMVLRIPYKLNPTGHVVTENYYKFHIDNNGSYSNPYGVNPNTIYDLTVKVVGFGGPTREDAREAYVTTTVRDWDVMDLPEEELGEFLEFDRMTAEVDPYPEDHYSYELADGEYAVGTGETIRIYGKTNSYKWYAVTHNKEGKLVHTSTGTTIVSPKERYIEVELPAVTGESTEYTIKIYHPRFAPENIAPLKTLTLKQAAGVIPNSRLVYEWDRDKLPPHGLQVAKRGNVLPSGTALPEDTMVPWSIEHVATGVKGLYDYGLGKSNTDKLLKLDPDKYPAVNLCKALGDGWYLPSSREWECIHLSIGVLCASYSFSYTVYWTSTEINNNSVYAMNFGARSALTYGKNTSNGGLGVRCFKDL